jgi:hypothetical protein
VIIYFHPTIFGRYNTPSSNKPYWSILAGFYASQNYVVVLPDFIGFSDSGDPHPYIVYPKQVVACAVHALNNVYDYIKSYFPLNNGTFNVYSVGYSEGASYSIWMSKCLSQGSCSEMDINLNVNYNYRKAAGLEGAYDLSGIMKLFLLNDVGKHIDNNAYQIEYQIITDEGKPGFGALTLLSYLTYTLNQQNSFPK